jgi:glycerol-3-phosphate acyltransferase PlsY
MLIVLLVIAAYLLGSIPSAVWIGKRFYGIDVRQYGSHNAGATNTLRVLGKKAALFVFLIDALKGFAAVSLATFSPYFAGSDPLFNLKIGLLAAAVFGHIFPIFAGFRGGKGVATLAGAMLAVYWPAVLLCLASFVVILALTKYVSLSSISAGILLPIYVVFVFGERSTSLIITCCVISLLLIFTHSKNIRRLLNGNESKINFSGRR